MFQSFNDWVRPYARNLADWGLTPNAISITRIILSPFVTTVYLLGGLSWTIVAVATLAFTDLLDGWLARLLGMETAQGKVLDALGDWTLALPVALLLLYLGEIPFRLDAWQPWCLLLILARNLSIAYVVLLQRERADTISRPEDARRMSGLLITSLAVLLINRSYPWLVFHQMGELCLGASTFFALVSWWQYLRSFRKA